MVTSKFQFTQPRIVSLQYAENDTFCSTKNEIELPISISPKITRNVEESIAIVKLDITVGTQDDKNPFWLSLGMIAQFRWETGSISDEDIKSLLKKNAVLLLISYARPIIATVTSQSRFPTYDLPYIDLTIE